MASNFFATKTHSLMKGVDLYVNKSESNDFNNNNRNYRNSGIYCVSNRFDYTRSIVRNDNITVCNQGHVF